MSYTRRRLVRTVGAGAVAAGLPSSVARASDAVPGTELWRVETGDSVYSSPTVVDGTAYVGSVDGRLYAVDADTGDRRWRFATGAAVFSSPAVAGDTAFACGYDGSLHAVDADTGDRRWRFDLDGLASSSPTAGDGAVYVGSGSGTLFAVDADTGDRRWRFETDHAPLGPPSMHGSPTLVDGTVYLNSGRFLYAVDADTGDRRWRFATGGDSSPTLAGDGRGPETARTTGDSVADTVYVGTDGGLAAVDAAAGDRRWRFETGGVVDASPTVADGTIYVGSDDGHLYAVDADTGDRQWRFATGGEVRSSPTVVDGTVYVGSDDGRLYAVETATSGASDGSRVRLGTLGHHFAAAGAGPPESGGGLARFDRDDDGTIGVDDVLDAVKAYATGESVGGDPVRARDVLRVVAAFNGATSV